MFGTPLLKLVPPCREVSKVSKERKGGLIDIGVTHKRPRYLFLYYKISFVPIYICNIYTQQKNRDYTPYYKYAYNIQITTEPNRWVGKNLNKNGLLLREEVLSKHIGRSSYIIHPQTAVQICNYLKNFISNVDF